MRDYERFYSFVEILNHSVIIKGDTDGDDETNNEVNSGSQLSGSTDSKGVKDLYYEYCDVLPGQQPLPHLVGKGVEWSAYRYPGVLRKYI